MWVYTGAGLVNVSDAQEITVERENASDRLTVFTVAATFGGQPRVPLARIELIFGASLVVSLDAGSEGPSLSPRERAERQARTECDACLHALAAALQAGAAYCDLSGLYTPVLTAATDTDNAKDIH